MQQDAIAFLGAAAHIDFLFTTLTFTKKPVPPVFLQTKPRENLFLHPVGHMTTFEIPRPTDLLVVMVLISSSDSGGHA